MALANRKGSWEVGSFLHVARNRLTSRVPSADLGGRLSGYSHTQALDCLVLGRPWVQIDEEEVAGQE